MPKRKSKRNSTSNTTSPRKRRKKTFSLKSSAVASADNDDNNNNNDNNVDNQNETDDIILNEQPKKIFDSDDDNDDNNNNNDNNVDNQNETDDIILNEQPKKIFDSDDDDDDDDDDSSSDAEDQSDADDEDDSSKDTKPKQQVNALLAHKKKMELGGYDNDDNDDDSDDSDDNEDANNNNKSNALLQHKAMLQIQDKLEDKAPKIPSNPAARETYKHLIVVLEKACLESVKVGNKFELLNSDDHGAYLRNKSRSIHDARPDITHQCLLALLDSPLNKAGRLQIYIHSQKNALIEVNPKTRIPRTVKRFNGLMVQLLHKMSIRAANGPEKLLKLIKNPVTSHFPASVKHVIGTSHTADKLMPVEDYVLRLNPQQPTVFVIGAMAHGKIEPDYVTDTLSISEYPLSAAGVCGKVCTAFERAWGIV